MPLLGFDSRFTDAVENGVAAAERRAAPHKDTRAKRQTIRAKRSDGRDPKPGDRLFLYTGLRTKKARKLGEVRCRSVERLRIHPHASGVRVTRDTEKLDATAIRRLARSDGFESQAAFIDFFERRHGLPFDGYLIRW